MENIQSTNFTNHTDPDKKAVSLTHRQLVVFVMLFISSMTMTLGAGVLLDRLFVGETTTAPVSSPTPSATPTDNTPDIPTSFKANTSYFDDTILLITKNEPHITVVASADRSQEDSNYKQSSRVSFFNGQDWSRKVTSSTNNTEQIQTNDIIKDWNITYDQSKVLKQSVTGTIMMDNNSIKFATQTLTNEMTIRSLPGYTKFMSEGTATAVINNVSYDCYVLYTRIYSNNAAELVSYDGSFNLTTDWAAFWDTAGNFYHLDSTNVVQDIPNYKSHTIGVFKNKDGSVQKTFTLNITRDAANPPVNYTINFGTPIDHKLTLTRTNGINKYPNNSYVWYVGNVAGTVTNEKGIKSEGVGLIEYINK